MRERRAPIPAILWLAASLLWPARGIAEPGEEQHPPGPLSVEMAAHRRLVEVMTSPDHRLEPFVTDGCSGGLSLAWGAIADLLPPFAQAHEEHPPWEACCVTHDRAYHAAGGARTAEQSYRARFAADEALRACVLATGELRGPQLAETYELTEAQITTAYELIADAMFNAVRLGGAPCSGLPWRWGYGYPGCLWPN